MARNTVTNLCYAISHHSQNTRGLVNKRQNYIYRELTNDPGRGFIVIGLYRAVYFHFAGRGTFLPIQ